MKVVFCSNYMNHHQLYFSQEMLKITGGEYRFIASMPIEEERLSGGWENMNEKYNWIIKAYKDTKEYNYARKLINEADLVIVGSFPMKILRKRIFSRKITFLYSERWFKTENGDISAYKNLHGYLSNLLHKKYLNYYNVYMLCASAYTAYDCSIYGNFIGKCYKWGYFPEVKFYDIENLIEKKRTNTPIELLWVARMIKWKHPEHAIYIANRLKKEGISFSLKMIGDGENLSQIKDTVEKSDLTDCVHVLGSLPANQVRGYMENANIFLFTSDYNEGWGVVLNEAMNSGCTVVASDAIGAVPFLINNGVNGYKYNYGDLEELYNHTKDLILNRTLAESMGRAAYRTITEVWNPAVAATRVVELYRAIVRNNKNLIPKEGICSPAEIISQGCKMNR